MEVWPIGCVTPLFKFYNWHMWHPSAANTHPHTTDIHKQTHTKSNLYQSKKHNLHLYTDIYSFRKATRNILFITFHNYCNYNNLAIKSSSITQVKEGQHSSWNLIQGWCSILSSQSATSSHKMLCAKTIPGWTSRFKEKKVVLGVQEKLVWQTVTF